MYVMMAVGGASAAFSRPTSATRQSHKSQLNSVVHKRKMSKQQVLKWAADTVIKFLEIYNSYEVLWDTSHENFSKRMQGDTIQENCSLNFKTPDQNFKFPMTEL